MVVSAFSNRGFSKKGVYSSYTTGLIARLRVSDKGQEGISAFLQKCPPTWQTSGGNVKH